MDPYKTNTDEFQQIQSIGSMREAKVGLKTAILSARLGQSNADFGVFGMNQGSK
jgi:hypothetical protein